jgi:hypothetical protein
VYKCNYSTNSVRSPYFEARSPLVANTDHLSTDSYGQGDRSISEEYGDNEEHKSIGQAAAIECYDEGDEYGDDEGQSFRTRYTYHAT